MVEVLYWHVAIGWRERLLGLASTDQLATLERTALGRDRIRLRALAKRHTNWGPIDQHFSTVLLVRSEAYSGTVLKLHAISLSKVERHVEKGRFSSA